MGGVGLRTFDRRKRYLVIVKEVSSSTIVYRKEYSGSALNRAIADLEY